MNPHSGVDMNTYSTLYDADGPYTALVHDLQTVAFVIFASGELPGKVCWKGIHHQSPVSGKYDASMNLRVD